MDQPGSSLSSVFLICKWNLRGSEDILLHGSGVLGVTTVSTFRVYDSHSHENEDVDF